MRETTRVAAVRTALDPIATNPLAAAVLAGIDRTGQVTYDSLAPLIRREHEVYSSGEKILLDLVLVLNDYGCQDAPKAHPAWALQTLGNRFLAAYVGALAIVATGGADIDRALAQAASR